MVSRIDGTKNTDLVGEIIRNKTSHKKLISFLYEIVVLQSKAFDLVNSAGFEHIKPRVPRLFHIWVVTYVSSFCWKDDMRYKC